ncbi:MAG: hypothetical protein RI959_2201, partial [Pseudomonadota bacterium]
PHVSPDDSALSRITRAGVASTLPRLAGLLQAGQDWAHSGVLEHRLEGKRGLPGNALWTPPESPGAAWSTLASPEQKAAAQLPDTAQALWHKQAAWLRPRALVQAQLAHPNITWQGATRVEAIERMVGGWRLRGFCGVAAEPWVCEAETVVLASAFNTLALLNTLGLQAPLNALRGQVTWGTVSSLPAHTAPFLPPFPVNGHGSFSHGMDFGLPATAHGPCWAVGSTFERGVTDPHILPTDQVANKARLARLLPHVHSQCEPGMDAALAWAGVRCTVPDRLPMVGFLAPESWPGLMVCAGMGARGLTLSVLCGEVLAAQYFGEPWPLERKLACALLAHRFAAKRV